VNGRSLLRDAVRRAAASVDRWDDDDWDEWDGSPADGPLAALDEARNRERPASAAHAPGFLDALDDALSAVGIASPPLDHLRRELAGTPEQRRIARRSVAVLVEWVDGVWDDLVSLYRRREAVKETEKAA
jgi:hypothetical protein